MSVILDYMVSYRHDGFNVLVSKADEQMMEDCTTVKSLLFFQL